MSRAFVREAGADAADALPDRPISPHPNFVTRIGAAKIDARLRELEATRSAALAADDRAAIAGIERELRYWKQRRSSARIIAPPAAPEIVRFGVTVRLRFDQGAERCYQLVGEDEADPAAGLLSWTSPVGSALIGHRTGDVVELSGQQAQILAMQA
ncbi:MAG TPA: GreA/GreB family elongation factor [Steroidobacteraceae bacterium]|jgi:transcription elongation GreA/GreB family factor|nr:GreA/GreB family elongation factor [Steroidobacteraceae bacterium]